MPDLKGPRGLLFLNGRVEIGPAVFDVMKCFETGLQPKAAEKAQPANADEQPKIDPLQRFTKIEPLGQLMEQCNAPAPVMQDKIAAYHHDRQPAGKEGVILVA